MQICCSTENLNSSFRQLVTIAAAVVEDFPKLVVDGIVFVVIIAISGVFGVVAVVFIVVFVVLLTSLTDQLL